MHQSLTPEQIGPIEGMLAEVLPSPIVFSSRKEIEELTWEQAMEVIRAARRMLLTQLLYQEYHEHMGDDCGDYLQAACENWHYLWTTYFDNDGDETIVVNTIKDWLLNPDDPIYGLGGCDGEIRYNLLTEELMSELDPEEV